MFWPKQDAAKNLTAKDTNASRKSANSKIQGLEDTIKRQQTKLPSLERQLTVLMNKSKN